MSPGRPWISGRELRPARTRKRIGPVGLQLAGNSVTCLGFCFRLVTGSIPAASLSRIPSSLKKNRGFLLGSSFLFWAQAPLLEPLEVGGARQAPSLAARSLWWWQRRKALWMSWRSTCRIICASVTPSGSSSGGVSVSSGMRWEEDSSKVVSLASNPRGGRRPLVTEGEPQAGTSH